MYCLLHSVEIVVLGPVKCRVLRPIEGLVLGPIEGGVLGPVEGGVVLPHHAEVGVDLLLNPLEVLLVVAQALLPADLVLVLLLLGVVLDVLPEAAGVCVPLRALRYLATVRLLKKKKIQSLTHDKTI